MFRVLDQVREPMEVIRRTTVEIRISGEQVEMLRRLAVLANCRIHDAVVLNADGTKTLVPLVGGPDPRLRAFVDELLEATRRE